MMRISTLPIVFFILLFAQDPARSKKVDLGEVFKIKKGEQVVVRGEKHRITFRSVENDSRCPTGVACVWAGNGEVVIEVAKKNQEPVVATLNTGLEPREIAYKGFKIKLVALNPYPKINEPIDQKDYEASMIVTRDE